MASLGIFSKYCRWRIVIREDTCRDISQGLFDHCNLLQLLVLISPTPDLLFVETPKNLLQYKFNKIKKLSYYRRRPQVYKLLDLLPRAGSHSRLIKGWRWMWGC